LQAYDGGPYTIDRVVRGETFIPNLSISLIGGIQPARLAELHGLTSDGLLQRFASTARGVVFFHRPDQPGELVSLRAVEPKLFRANRAWNVRPEVFTALEQRARQEAARKAALGITEIASNEAYQIVRVIARAS
jgi:hypothetical protein